MGVPVTTVTPRHDTAPTVGNPTPLPRQRAESYHLPGPLPHSTGSPRTGAWQHRRCHSAPAGHSRAHCGPGLTCPRPRSPAAARFLAGAGIAGSILRLGAARSCPWPPGCSPPRAAGRFCAVWACSNLRRVQNPRARPSIPGRSAARCLGSLFSGAGCLW